MMESHKKTIITYYVEIKMQLIFEFVVKTCQYRKMENASVGVEKHETVTFSRDVIWISRIICRAFRAFNNSMDSILF